MAQTATLPQARGMTVIVTAVANVWQVVSESDASKTYIVAVNTLTREGLCGCRGFEMRGSCKHLDYIRDRFCAQPPRPSVAATPDGLFGPDSLRSAPPRESNPAEASRLLRDALDEVNEALDTQQRRKASCLIHTWEGCACRNCGRPTKNAGHIARCRPCFDLNRPAGDFDGDEEVS